MTLCGITEHLTLDVNAHPTGTNLKFPSKSNVKRNTFGPPSIPSAINNLPQKKNGAIDTPNPVSLNQDINSSGKRVEVPKSTSTKAVRLLYLTPYLSGLYILLGGGG